MSSYKYLKISWDGPVKIIHMYNPLKANAMNEIMWEELGHAAKNAHQNDQCRAVILSGIGKHFTSGIDTAFLKKIMEEVERYGASEREEQLKKFIVKLQQAISAFEECKKPIIAAIHGVCIGGGVDLISACDVRLSTKRAYFSIMETKLGIVADVGTLQRLPYIMGEGRVRELALTSEIFTGKKAMAWGLVNQTYLTKGMVFAAARKMAHQMAKLPSYALYGTKQVLNNNRTQNIKQGLDYVATLNARLMLSPEAQEKFKNLR